jgi:hypothetical protein
MKKISKVLGCIVPFLCALLIQFGVSVIAMMGYGFVQGFKLASEGETDPTVIAESITSSLSSELLLTISALSAVIAILVFGLWYKKSIKNNVKTNIREVFQLKHVGFIIILGIALQIGVSTLLNLIAAIKPEWFDNYGELMEQLGMGNSLISVIYIAIIAPISEELIFRGVILEKSKKVMPYAVANVFQAVLFGIYHMNLVQGIYAFAIGMFMGLVCLKLRSIYGAILLHIAINTGGILLNMVLNEGMDISNIILAAMVILAGIAIVASTLYFSRIKTNEEPIDMTLEL